VSERARRIEELFHRAADLPRERRAGFLDLECPDGSLRAELERLLRSDETAPPRFLERRPCLAGPTLATGDVLAGYTIVQRIGEGGMGTVYAARQASPRRLVALKVIRPDRLSAEALRRFQREAEVLGHLQHPGIAQVLQAGTAEVSSPAGARFDQPFLAMELVRGIPLRRHAGQRALDARARLELFARICDAVHHAHQRGVIHRDLKPANVLVADDSEPGGPGQPKILDFGIARVAARGPVPADETCGTNLLGTLAYIAPEQVAGNADVDVRADVYSLGVILYELLSGRLPIDVAGASLAEAVRRVTESDPQALESLAPELRGDVSAIAAKALEKDREQRYQSAAELAGDVRRYLRGDPIEARASSSLYLLRRRLRRHRTLLASAAVVLAASSVFAVVATMQARHNRGLARSEASARAAAEFELASSNVERGRLHGLLGNPLGEDLLWREYLRAPESTGARSLARWALWEYYVRNPCLATRAAHGGEIRGLVLHPDGRWLASGGLDGTLRLWEPEGLEPLAELDLGAPVLALALAPDGGRLAAALGDGALVVLDTGSLQQRERMEVDGPREFAHIDFDPSHPELLAVAGDDQRLRLLDLDQRCCVALEEGPVYARFGPGGMLATSDQGAIAVRHSAGEPPWLVLDGHGRSAVAFSADGTRLFTGSPDRALRMWDLESGKLLEECRPNSGSLRRIWTSADGSALYTLGWWRIDVWSTETLEPLASVDVSSMGWGAVSAPDEHRLYFAGHGYVRVWELPPGAGERVIGGHAGRTVAELSPDGERVASGDESGTVRVFDVPTGGLIATSPVHAGRVRAIRFHPSGRRVATGGFDRRLALWSAEDGSLLYSSAGYEPSTAGSIDFSPDGALIAAAWEGGRFLVARTADGEPCLELDSGGREALWIRFSPDGKYLAGTARNVTAVRLWDLDGGLVAELSGRDGQPWSLAFSPDGKRLAEAGWSRQVVVWDLETRSRAAVLEGHGGTVWNVAFAPEDPDLLASGAADGAVRLWSVSMARNLATLEACAGDVLSLGFGPRGRTLVASDSAGEVRVWDRAHFERHLAGNLEYQRDRVR